ncbi:MAG: hydroxyacylglutathione hydrolase family protein [Candidatus Pacearchaeota archaeon]
MEVVKFKGGFDRNFSYLIYNKSMNAFVIDPFPIKDYFEKAKELNVKIIGILNTHNHFDHTSGNEFFKNKGIDLISNKNKIIKLGEEKIEVIETPGHTKDSVCFYADGKLFTGDTLFVGGIGATFSKEDEKKEFESLKKLIKLPDKTAIYPGHDYGDKEESTIGEEKKINYYLKSL